jgi:DNA invertase Pin-like site-specific DNA recombinase
MKKIVYYIRCSTMEQNPNLQIKDLDSICDVPHDIYKENESAWADNVIRPEFNKILALIKKRKITDLYVWDLDRAYRNRKRLQEFFVLCKTYNCKIHSYRQKWLESINSIPAPFDEIVQDMLINIFGWIAEEESSKRSERIKLAIKKSDKGTFSYKGNKWGKKSLPQQTVNQILELHKQGKSIRQIASEVTFFDKNRNEKKVSKSAVHKLVSQMSP